MLKESVIKNYCITLGLLALITFICYSNTFNASWHLDDYHNIVSNPRVHMNALSADAVSSSFYGAPRTDTLNRPVAYFSFAVNWFFGKDCVFGYHLVNLIIHILTAVLLFFTIFKLFSVPKLKHVSKETIIFVPLFAAALWAVHPIQVQTVTYIVQRMASLSALFYLAGIMAYLSGRLSLYPQRRFIWYGLCAIFYLLAVGTKENTILLPVSLLLVEFVFFRDLQKPEIRGWFFRFVSVGVLGIVVGGIIVTIYGPDLPFFTKYQLRPFSPVERLLTEFRILIFYLYQIIYPIPTQFNIDHYFSISTSLFTPWTTLPSMILVTGLLAFGLWALFQSSIIKILGFSILFFFINHLVESTFLPLELVFEHRNYLPSFFIFVPIGLGIHSALNYYQHNKKGMFYFMAGSVSVLLVGVAMSTYVRNMDWRTEKSLWTDAMIKSPETARPLQNLAWGYYRPTGRIETAIELNKRSVTLYDNAKGFEMVSYFNLAGIYFSEYQDYENTILYAGKALDIEPNHTKAAYLLMNALAMSGEIETALELFNANSNIYANDPELLYLKGLILLKKSHLEPALTYFRQSLRLNPHEWRYLREIGIALTHMGFETQGFWFLKQALNRCRDKTQIFIYLADNRITAEDLAAAKQYVDQFADAVGSAKTAQWIKTLNENPLSPPVFLEGIIPLISKSLVEKSDFLVEQAILLENMIE